MDQPPDLLKEFANRMARYAVSDDGTHLARMLRLTGLLGHPRRPAPEQSLTDNIGNRRQPGAAPAAADAPPRVGIWEGKNENGRTYFARRMDMVGEWNFWANVGRIEPKEPGRRRVVLIGESVARGYLYDPQFTVAQALEAVLRSQLGQDEVEVVDLARTNLGLEVKDLAVSALHLDPDAVIIFSGNNWQLPYPPSSTDMPVIDTLLREEGIPGFKRYAERRVAEEAREVVRVISSHYEAEGVPLIWMVPEFNLGDWRDPLTNAPHLRDDLNREWLALWEQARRAQRDGDYQAAGEAAQKMTQLDQGVAVAGLYVLAENSGRAGDLEAARRYLELARDAVIWDTSRSISPRPLGVTQQALREEVGRTKGELVDLPQVFKEYLKGGIPGRRMFLDYCHLTAEAIQVSVAAAASRVLRLFKGAELPWRMLIDERVAPGREVEAEAAFLAAIHNAHWWQPSDLVHHYCMRAAQSSPSIAQVMTRYIDLQTRRAPMLMCKSAEQIAGMGSPLLQHYLLRYNNQQLDQHLLDGVVLALKKLGIDAAERLEQLRREEHSVAVRDTNLLDYYYCSAGLQPQEVTWALPRHDVFVKGRQRHYYKAYSPESRFVFVGEAGLPLSLSLTCRIRNLEDSDGTIAVELNGRERREIAEVSRDWQTWEISVGGEVTRDGLNEVVVYWPVPSFPGLRGLHAGVDSLIEKTFPEFFCEFGDIHTFTVSDGRKAKTTAPAAAEEARAVPAL
jgi:hypothetical protein